MEKTWCHTQGVKGRGLVAAVAAALTLGGCEPEDEPGLFVKPLVQTAAASSGGGEDKPEPRRRSEDLLQFSEDEVRPVAEAGEGSGATVAVASLAPALSDSAAGDSAPRFPNGAACRLHRECESEACIEGFCCSSQCDEVCSTCAAPGQEGTCTATESDGACLALLCPQDTECMGYDSQAARNNCLAVGVCSTTATCTELPKPEGTVCGPQGEGECDGTGSCRIEDKASLGDACELNADCAEGNCVQGADGARVCCDTACDGVCEACSGRGRCELVPQSDSRCGAVECPADGACRDYPDSLPAGVCRGLGQCQVPEDCLDDFSLLRPESSCSCDRNGNCELRVGEGCESDAQCGPSQQCLSTLTGEGVCCAERCPGGLSCSRDGRSCVECEGSEVVCQGSDELRCVGGSLVPRACANGCALGVGCESRAPLGASCAVTQCQSGTSCDIDEGGQARCCELGCNEQGGVCGRDGRCTCPAGQILSGNGCVLDDGARCSTNGQCESGFCVDGVCCGSRCNGACEQCAAGSGQCVPLAEGSQDAQCSGDSACTGQVGQCAVSLGRQCRSNRECGSGECVGSTGDGPQICCSSDCPTGRFCSSDGQRCVQCERDSDCPNGCDPSGRCRPEVRLGGSCQQSSQCAGDTAACLTGRCCEFACGAEQKVCNTSGRCVCPEGQVDMPGRGCEVLPDTTPPTIARQQIAGSASSLQSATFQFSAATDDRTLQRDLQYALVHSLSDVFGGLTAEQVSEAASSGRTIAGARMAFRREFSTGTALGTIRLPDKATLQYFVVLVRDAAGNLSAYEPTTVDFRGQEPSACTSNSECLSQCVTLFVDNDGDCFPSSPRFVRRCIGEGVQRTACHNSTELAFRIEENGVAYVSGEASGDCDDTETIVSPAQENYFITERENGTYDYNCDGVESTEELSSARTTCTLDEVGESFGYLAGSGGCGDRVRLRECFSTQIGPRLFNVDETVISCH